MKITKEKTQSKIINIISKIEILVGTTKKHTTVGTLSINFKRKLDINTVNINSEMLEKPLIFIDSIVSTPFFHINYVILLSIFK